MNPTVLIKQLKYNAIIMGLCIVQVKIGYQNKYWDIDWGLGAEPPTSWRLSAIDTL